MTDMNATAALSASSGLEGDVFSFVWSVFLSSRSEVLLFVAAVVAYFALFMQRPPKKVPTKKIKVVEDNWNEDDYPTDTLKDSATESEDHASVERALEAAFDGGDYRSVLRCWNTMKKFNRMPAVSLPHVVESMQRFKKDTPFILKELKAFLKKFPSECDMVCINDLLEALGKRMDSDLMEKVVEMLPSIDLKMDERSYEIFLNMHFTTRSFQEVKALVSQMKDCKVPYTTRAAMAVIKTALKTSSFDEALLCFRELKGTWTACDQSTTPSTAPTHLVTQLVDLACREHKLDEMIVELTGMKLSEEAINAMLTECVRQKDLILTQKVEQFARGQEICFSDVTYGLLIKAMSMDQIRVQALFDEVVEKGVVLTADFAGSVLALCAQTSNVQMADKLYQHMKPTQVSILSTFIRFYADNEQHEKACDVYEQDLLRVRATSPGGSALLDSQMDARMERSLMNAALKCGRSELAQKLLSASPSDIAKHITMIRNCAAERNLQGAVSVFTSLEQSGVDLNSVIYNTVLDACVECRDLQAAEAWMEQTKKAGMADVVSFNTLIKAHLQSKNFDQARALMEELRKEGLQPNRVTFNELINGLASTGQGERQRKQMWDAVEEMTAADVKPNQVTISILLKSLNSYSKHSDIMKTMDLIDAMDEPMDEVLLSSVVEACVRIGKVELLASKLKQFQSNTSIAISGSHTYGSLIKAYGHVKDINGVWRCWKEMRSRYIKPTSITLGCMVEAVVSNGDTEGAFDLIHQMRDDEQCSAGINSVIYCSVLKGFTRERKVERVWEVYEEMSTMNVELSIVTYNTLIDACARSGRMDRLPKILEDMKTYNVKPNVITYSTMLKGHCQNGDVQTGFAILEEMKTVAHLKPDEIMYNSLIDGCAQNNLVEDGLRLLEEMQASGVNPSNFTLSILVKLMNRARKLEKAFSLVEEITKKHNFQPNVHVYTNLIQACVSNQQLTRGFSVLEQMAKEHVAPESRTYAILVRACLSKGLYEKAAGLLKGALGLPDAPAFLQAAGASAACAYLEPAFVNETLASLADRGHAKDLAVPLLSSIRQHAPKVRIDKFTQQKVMSPCLGKVASEESPSVTRGGNGTPPWRSKGQGRSSGN